MFLNYKIMLAKKTQVSKWVITRSRAGGLGLLSRLAHWCRVAA